MKEIFEECRSGNKSQCTEAGGHFNIRCSSIIYFVM
jgi:hypothetical protein